MLRYAVLGGLLALGIGSLVSGCTATSTKVDNDDFNPENLSYVFDARSKLCFAVIGYERVSSSMSRSSGMSFSNVPCTDEVMAMIPGAIKKR